MRHRSSVACERTNDYRTMEPNYRTIDNRNQVKTIDAYRLWGRHHPMGKNSVATLWQLQGNFEDTLIY